MSGSATPRGSATRHAKQRGPAGKLRSCVTSCSSSPGSTAGEPRGELRGQAPRVAGSCSNKRSSMSSSSSQRPRPANLRRVRKFAVARPVRSAGRRGRDGVSRAARRNTRSAFADRSSTRRQATQHGQRIPGRRRHFQRAIARGSALQEATAPPARPAAARTPSPGRSLQQLGRPAADSPIREAQLRQPPPCSGRGARRLALEQGREPAPPAARPPPSGLHQRSEMPRPRAAAAVPAPRPVRPQSAQIHGGGQGAPRATASVGSELRLPGHRTSAGGSPVGAGIS